MTIVHPDDRQMIEDALVATIEQKVPHELEFRAVRPDKTETNIRTRGEITLDAAGNAVGITGTTQDITERKRA
jgi:PAS domain S-box-containing protein